MSDRFSVSCTKLWPLLAMGLGYLGLRTLRLYWLHQRKWRQIVTSTRNQNASNNESSSRSSSDAIRVVSYNVLAKHYFRRKGPVFEWAYRSNLLVNQLQGFHADLVALQEVDQYQETFFPAMTQCGYTGIFLKRPVEIDGLAVFYKPNRFALRRRKDLCFDENADTRGQTHNVAILLEFECLRLPSSDALSNADFQETLTSNGPVPPPARRRRFLFVATHFYWDPRKDDIKIRQAFKLLTAIAEFNPSSPSATTAASATPSEPPPLPVLICGDFNSLPGSSVYQLFSKGKAKFTSAFGKDINATLKERRCPTFESAYATLKDPYTNLKENFHGCLDYIWLSRSDWQLHGLLDPPATKGPFPSAYQPSDHIPLMCEVSFQKPSH